MEFEKITAAGLFPASRLAGEDNEEPPSEDQVEACRRWIRRFGEPTKSFVTRHNSYGHKHRVEDWTRTGEQYEQVDPWGRRWTGDYLYIANGAFIEAARREGYRVRRGSEGSPNAVFNMRVLKRGREVVEA
jgi:hypothetical protein